MHSDKNTPAICESIMLFDALHKHKVCIDAILEGLEMFKLKKPLKFSQNISNVCLLRSVVYLLI